MNETEVDHMHHDVEELKRDIAIIKHILSEEGKLTAAAKKELSEARKTPDSEYVKHNELKRRVLHGV